MDSLNKADDTAPKKRRVFQIIIGIIAAIIILIMMVALATTCSPGQPRTVANVDYCLQVEVIDSQADKLRAVPRDALYASRKTAGENVSPCLLSIRPDNPAQLDRDNDYAEPGWSLTKVELFQVVTGTLTTMTDANAADPVAKLVLDSLVVISGTRADYAFSSDLARPVLAGLVVEQTVKPAGYKPPKPKDKLAKQAKVPAAPKATVTSVVPASSTPKPSVAGTKPAPRPNSGGTSAGRPR